MVGSLEKICQPPSPLPFSLLLSSIRSRLSNPIMSLVDTAVVGAQSSIELAALGPATSLCDNLAYICGFLAQVDRRHTTLDTFFFHALFFFSCSSSSLYFACGGKRSSSRRVRDL